VYPREVILPAHDIVFGSEKSENFKTRQFERWKPLKGVAFGKDMSNLRSISWLGFSYCKLLVKLLVKCSPGCVPDGRKHEEQPSKKLTAGIEELVVYFSKIPFGCIFR